MPLINALGGRESVLEQNHYKQEQASFCLVLPPVGSARIANLLLDCIGDAVNEELFLERHINIQVCSPGRLDERRSAMLAVGFYLGSDHIRRYNQVGLETTFSRNISNTRGTRYILYDASGTFDSDFFWWQKFDGRHTPVISDSLPSWLYNKRSDVLAGSASPLDIKNINLIASLLVHSQYEGCKGYWYKLGRSFEEDFIKLLDRHLLSGLLKAAWVYTDDVSTHDDTSFAIAQSELVAYALDEVKRLKVQQKRFPWQKPELVGNIMQEMNTLLMQYRAEVEEVSQKIKGET